MSTPVWKRHGDDFHFQWPDHGVGVTVSKIYESHHDVIGELLFTTLEGGHIHLTKVNLLAGRRGDLAKLLTQRANHIAWDIALEQVCTRTAMEWRTGEPVVLVQPRPREAVRSLVEPAIVLNHETTILYGDGGSGKSAFAAAVAATVATGRELPGGIRPTQTGPVLYLDYEDLEETLAERLHGLQVGMGFPAIEHVHYRRMIRPLAADIDVIRAEVDRLGAALVIVDSITPAAGAEPEGADAATRTLNALRSVRAAKLVVAHLSKTEATSTRGASRPWGSTFYWNLARSAWEFRRASDADEGPVRVALYHRKSNVSRLYRPIGLVFEFAGDGRSWAIRPGSIDDSPDLAARMSLSHQIRAALLQGARTVDALAEEIGASPDVTRRTLNRLRSRGTAIQLSGDGREKRWGLAARGAS